MTEHNEKPLPSQEPQPEKNKGIKRLRTFSSDIARMMREHKLTKGDIAKLDPKLVSAIEHGEVPDDMGQIDTVQVTSNDDTEADLLLKARRAETENVQSNQFEEKTLDLDTEEATQNTQEEINVVQAEQKAEPAPEPQIIETPQEEQPVAVAIKEQEPQPVQKEEQTIEPAPEPIPEPKVEVEPEQPIEQKPEPTPESVVSVASVPEPIAEPQPEPKKEQTLVEKFQEAELELENQLEKLKQQEKDLLEKEAELERQKIASETQAAPILAREQEIENAEAELRKQVTTVESLEERKNLEKQRWAMEDERQRIENERWTIDQNIVDLEKQIMGISAEESELKEEEVEVEHKIERIKKMLLALQAKSEKDEVEKKLEEIVVSRVQLENEWKEIMETKKKAEAIDAEYLRQEAVLQAEIQAIEAEEQTATKDKKHEFETIRWEKEKQLRRLEEEDWKDEEDVKELQRLTEDLQNRTQSVLSLEKQTKTKIAELNALIASAEEDE
jgi:hypothetical protein